jgi:hypothetical protein
MFIWMEGGREKTFGKQIYWYWGVTEEVFSDIPSIIGGKKNQNNIEMLKKFQINRDEDQQKKTMRNLLMVFYAF